MQNLIDRLPAWFPDVAFALLLVGLGVFAALLVHRIAFRILDRITGESETSSDGIVVAHIRRPARWALVALGIVLAARETALVDDAWHKVAGFVMPALVGWMALSIMKALVEAAVLKADITVSNNLEARRKRTRLAIFSRIGAFLIIFVTVGLMLLSIPGVRDVGVTLMASAGLAGLAVGAAAQPALKSLISGLQMALTEPIRIDDVVIVDGQWGRIEDIRTTYVVVKIWDERRLIVPSNFFLEQTFQNWTRHGAELLGTVFLHLDPLAEIAPLRAAFEDMVENHPLWDGRAKAMQVTETGPSSIEVRLLMSAANSANAFDLRCAVREGMLEWIRVNQPRAIARQRVDAPDAAGLEMDAAPPIEPAG
ncbi:mechanosensitive ion channel family protein [Altererythrobacter sp. KTW20L]|uniref:mechanosensitive ion channel family protein n=1 Tax=Altererythrobacter sp. KTW20L TaxID=2942210 RepID=UPI0020C16AD8|nr:mechanosensitive ion channel domain-containing protein [Altererythrobacter sp. KTW20L]MCL6249763.1 mechanosensitive ion channel family protein [Altererythrobacter sp. KTW20L]